MEAIDTAAAPSPRSLTMLNEQGDLTIAWGPEDDAKMRKIIEAKMAAGVAFFLIEPRPVDAPSARRQRLKEVDQAFGTRQLQVRDADLKKFLQEGSTGRVVKTGDAPIRTTRRARSAEEAASGQSVGVRPARGG